MQPSLSTCAEQPPLPLCQLEVVLCCGHCSSEPLSVWKAGFANNAKLMMVTSQVDGIFYLCSQMEVLGLDLQKFLL